MIAKKITQARLEKNEIPRKVEIKKLSEDALKKVSENFMLYPDLKNLDYKSKLRVYDRISVSHPIDVVFNIIDYEYYWQRACAEEFRTADCSNHGNSWKQCYAENYIKNLITKFDAEKGDKIEDVVKYFDIMKYNIFNLEIPTFSADFNLSKIPQYFVNLTSLELKYSPILSMKEERKMDILKKKLVPIKDEYSKFGIRMADLKVFSVALGDLNYLLNLNLQGNFIDDEMITWLVTGLISNHTLRHLDLSNNKITEKGTIKIASYLMRTKCLVSIDLTNNRIGGKGGFALSLVIKENTKIKIIKIAMNRLDDLNASKIIKAVGKNIYLEELDLSSNECGQFSSENLITCLKMNKAIKSLDLSYSNVWINQDTKTAIEQHPTLVKLELQSTKTSSEDIKFCETTLVKKSVRQNLLKRRGGDTTGFD